MEKTRAGVKKAVLHEMGEYLWFLLYMALFFFIFATYKMLVEQDFHNAWYVYSTAFLNSLVLSKVVMLGQHAHVGTRHEDRSLLLSSIYKSFLFAVLVAIFHVTEDFVKDLVHGAAFSEALQELAGRNFERLLAYTVVVFCVFIPFFAIWETRRVMEPERFDHLFFRRGKPSLPR